MTKLNGEIAKDTKNLGPGFCIGHSFFVPAGDGPFNESWYRAVVEQEIRPLLDEYWFDAPKRAAALAEGLLS